MRFIVLFTIIIFATIVSSSDGEMYKWVDEKGTVHFTDDLSNIPAKYRQDAEKRKPQKEILPAELMEKPKSSTPAPTQKPIDSEAVEVEMMRKGEIWSTEVLLNEKVKRNLIVDSGASFTLINSQTAKELDLMIDENTPRIPLTTVSGSILAPLVTLQSIQVGKAVLRNVETVIHSLPFGGDGLLGNSFLNKYKVTLDSTQGKMILHPMKGIPSPDRPGGYGRDFWVNQFRFYRNFLEVLKKIKKNYEDRGANSAGSELSQINAAIRYFENQLDEWDRRASFAGVPRNWRQ